MALTPAPEDQLRQGRYCSTRLANRRAQGGAEAAVSAQNQAAQAAEYEMNELEVAVAADKDNLMPEINELE